MLIEHRVDDVDEGFVAVEEAVPPRQQVAFEPAFAQVLAQDLHHASVWRYMGVLRLDVRYRHAFGDLEDVAPTVGARLIRAEDRSEEHTSELQSRENLVCRLLLE